jgi:hypothetical protein
LINFEPTYDEDYFLSNPNYEYKDFKPKIIDYFNKFRLTYKRIIENQEKLQLVNQSFHEINDVLTKRSKVRVRDKLEYIIQHDKKRYNHYYYDIFKYLFKLTPIEFIQACRNQPGSFITAKNLDNPEIPRLYAICIMLYLCLYEEKKDKLLIFVEDKIYKFMTQLTQMTDCIHFYNKQTNSKTFIKETFTDFKCINFVTKECPDLSLPIKTIFNMYIIPCSERVILTQCRYYIDSFSFEPYDPQTTFSKFKCLFTYAGFMLFANKTDFNFNPMCMSYCFNDMITHEIPIGLSQFVYHAVDDSYDYILYTPNKLDQFTVTFSYLYGDEYFYKIPITRLTKLLIQTMTYAKEAHYSDIYSFVISQVQSAINSNEDVAVPIDVQRVVIEYLFQKHINFSRNFSLPKSSNYNPKFVTTRGICYNSAVEKESDVVLDIKHLYEIKLPEIKQVYYYNLKSIIGILLMLSNLEDRNKVYFKNFSTIFGVNNIIAAPFVSFKQCQRDVIYVINLNKIPYEHLLDMAIDYIDSITLSENRSFKIVIDQLKSYSLWWSQSPYKNKKFKSWRIFHNYHDIIYHYYSDIEEDEYTIKSSYNPPRLFALLKNLCKIHTLHNFKVQDIECTCRTYHHSLRTILPLPRTSAINTIIYNNCNRNLYASFKRQCKKVPFPDWNVINEFKIFVKDKIDKIFSRIPDKVLDYSYAQWFNKEPIGKQKVLSAVIERTSFMERTKEYDEEGNQSKYYIKRIPINLDRFIQSGAKCFKVEHELFCKAEKQEPGGKNRAIAAISQHVKYIMGPICWLLEHIFTDYTKYYSGGKNADDYSKYYTKRKGEMVIEGDGSGFDQTQFFELKYVDRYIYRKLAQRLNLYHIYDRKELFLNIASTPIKTLRAIQVNRITKKRYDVLKADIIGTVFSGSSDTTLMNTNRMAFYNWFTLSKVLDKYKGDNFVGLHKGDDFVEFPGIILDQQKIKDTYEKKYWCLKSENEKNPNIIRGLGQIIKVLDIKPIDESKFCSGFVAKNKRNIFYYMRDLQRMARFAFWSRKACSYKASVLKQYLLDQAVAIEASGLKNVLMFRSFYKCYMNEYNRIKDEPERVGTGLSKMHIPDDGHSYYFINDIDTDKYIYRYDIDYYYSRLKNDRSSIVELTDDEMYEALYKQFHWNPKDINEFCYYLENVSYDDTLRDNKYEVIPDGEVDLELIE